MAAVSGHVRRRVDQDRGDSCWRDLTCLNYYFETQPIPNPVSWYFHWLPEAVHKAGVAFNHVVELVVPFLYFAPQPFAGVAGLLTIAFQGVLIVSGNLSWLNWLTLTLCIPTLDHRFLTWLPITPPALHEPSLVHRGAIYALAAVVAALSVAPTLNMLSASQIMNTSFEPFHLVNTYGAFGSITRTRYEIVIEGTDDQEVTSATKWREYEFKGKPGDPLRRAPQIAPYHPPPRLVDVVRGVFPAATKRMVHFAASPAAARRRRDPVAAGDESVPEPPSHAFCAHGTTVIRFTTPQERRPDRPLVEPAARRRICAGDYPRSLSTDSGRGHPRRRPRPLKVEAANPTIDVEHLANQVQPAADARFHGRRVDLGERNPTGSDLCVVVSAAVADIERRLEERMNQPSSIVARQVRQRRRGIDARAFCPEIRDRCGHAGRDNRTNERTSTVPLFGGEPLLERCERFARNNTHRDGDVAAFEDET
jgi:hypothetical protein